MDRKRFAAKKIDLMVDVVTLDGEELQLHSQKALSANYTKEIMAHWTALETNIKEGEDIDRVNLLARELAFVYDQDEEWFMSNFDFGTLQDILSYVAECIGGLAKKEASLS